MINIKINLIYFKETKKYVLIDEDPDHLTAKGHEVVWSFNADKFRLAKKLLRNLNHAASINMDTDYYMLKSKYNI